MKPARIFLIIILVAVTLATVGALGANWRASREKTPNNAETEATQTHPLKPGDYAFLLRVDNSERKYLLHVPASYNKQNPTPLVLVFHGAMGSADIMAKSHEWVPKSEAEGFIVAFPNGASRSASGNLATWNAGDCCGYARQSHSDDVGFVKAAINDIKHKANIGDIFAAGMSNGGMFSYRLACEMSDTFSAVASVSGTDNYPECQPQHPISIVHIHGLKDDRVLFYGGCGSECQAKTEPSFTSVPDTIAKWVQRDHCNSLPQTVTINENAYYDVYGGCDEGKQIKLYVIKDGGHSWPTTATTKADASDKEPPSHAISATDEIWNFFKANMATRQQ